MTKSALCIGVVALAAAGAGGFGDFHKTLDRGGREVATRLGQACATSETCAGLGSRIVTAAIAGTGMEPAASVGASLEGSPPEPAVVAPAAPGPAGEPARAGHRIARHVPHRPTARD